MITVKMPLSQIPRGDVNVSENHREKLYPLCDRMRNVAFEMMSQCELPVTDQGMTHPKILALALLSRTLANLKGVIELVNKNLAVEARVIARCCFENMSAFKETYLVYSQLSGDAAHPTLMALARHWGPAGGTTAYFEADPEVEGSELDETLHLACVALMGVMVVVNEMHGYPEAGKRLPELNRELQGFQNEKWGDAAIGEGIEIRTEA
jgi:hypothetical protein